MSETQENDESLHTEVEIKPTLNERALLAIGHPLTQEENNRFYAKIQKSSEDIKGPFVCLVCAYSSREWNVKVHVRTHTGERPYKCTFCPKKFTKKCDCDQHMRTHTGDEPYQCKFCLKKFKKKSDCDRHIRSHTGEKPYSCPFCPLKFTRKDNCESHIQNHTGEKPYGCTFCPKKFATKQRCYQHIRTHI